MAISPTTGATNIVPGQPLQTADATQAVTVPNSSGSVTFQLVVTDNLGVQSAPVTATVTIQAAPVAVLTATPATVAAGGVITLSATGSSAGAPGSIAQYSFSVLPTGTTTTANNTVAVSPAVLATGAVAPVVALSSAVHSAATPVT